MKRLLLFLLVCLLFSSCSKKLGQYQPVNNANDDFDVEFLFECNGVNVYRFYDCGYYRYFTTGNGNYLPTTIRQSNGKTSVVWVDGAEER